MANSREYKKSAESIKQKIRILNSIALLIIAVLLFVIVRFLYSFLDYMPSQSIVVLLSVTAVLVITGAVLVRITSRNAINAIEEYSMKLDTLLDTTKNIHEIVHSDVLFDNIMDVSLKFTDADAGSVALLEGDTLVVKTVKGRDIRKLQGASFPRSTGFAGWAADNGTALRIDDANNDSRFYPSLDMITDHEIRSVLCVPLRSRKGTVGVMELVNKKTGPFTAEDEEFISYFADQAATSIERVKFFEDEKNYEIHLTNILIDALEYIPEKQGHSRRVAKYTLLMAHALHMTEPEQKKLYHAALLHDIGFLKIRHDVVSLEEFQKHPLIAYEMLNPINFYAHIAPLVLHHHERYDGTGYPSGLKGEEIPRESRMVYIAEAFDAMVSGNSYKKIGKVIFQNLQPPVTGFNDAIEELRKNAGTQFDPELVEVFVNNVYEDYSDIK